MWSNRRTTMECFPGEGMWSERVWGVAAAALGLILGILPSMLAKFLPQIVDFDQLGVVLLGIVIGLRAGASLSSIDSPLFGAARPAYFRTAVPTPLGVMCQARGTRAQSPRA